LKNSNDKAPKGVGKFDVGNVVLFNNNKAFGENWLGPAVLVKFSQTQGRRKKNLMESSLISLRLLKKNFW
jgi:hypothetical protein